MELKSYGKCSVKIENKNLVFSPSSGEGANEGEQDNGSGEQNLCRELSQRTYPT